MLWLKLGDGELINLAHARSIKKGADSTIEIYMDPVSGRRVLPFSNDEQRNQVFQKLIQNLIKMRMALE
ncbi:MAG: hypothetical protein H3C43_08215 [Leptonema sp. (in: Bacteria)]|nr:hypothetical protein [Leptonema sp. (in: bacteria)]